MLAKVPTEPDIAHVLISSIAFSSLILFRQNPDIEKQNYKV